MAVWRKISPSHHSRESGNLIAPPARYFAPEFGENMRLAAQRFPLSREWCYFCFFLAEKFGDVAEILHREGILRYNRSESEKCVCGGADVFLRVLAIFLRKRKKMMKNSTLATRAVCAAFMRVLCAIPASFLNLKGGGGGQKMNARSMAFVRVCGCVLAAFFALQFAAEKAHASPIRCPEGQVNGVASTTLDSVCVAINIEEPVNTPNVAVFADTPDVVAAVVNGVNPIPARVNIINRSAADITLSSSSELVLYPKDTRLPPLTLANLTADVVVMSQMEESLRFTNDDDLNPILDQFAGQQYYSMPAAVLQCGDEMLNELMNDCIPIPQPEEPVCEAGEKLNEARDECIPDNVGGDASAPARTESKVRDNAWTAFGGALAVGVLSYLLSDGTLLGYSATPDFGYSLTDSGYSLNAGGRVDFRKDGWHLYWTAGQQSVNGDFGDFRYSSGGKWQGDIFAAAFSEKVQGKTADYDLSLSANYDGGIWKLSPAFAIDSVYEKGEFATTNSFRINGEMRYDDWRFSASGNKTQMELSATLEF